MGRAPSTVRVSIVRRVQTSTSSSADGLLDVSTWRARQDEFLRFATDHPVVSSLSNAAVHLERSRRDADFSFDGSALVPDAFSTSFAKIADLVDTADFDLIELLHLRLAFAKQLSHPLRQAIDTALFGFVYWYTDDVPHGKNNHMFYWSENHRILFHAAEYLAGQLFPSVVFSDGRTGSAKQLRAATLIGRWVSERAQFGFSEWLSDVYYAKDAVALLSLVEWAEDPQIAAQCTATLDLLLLDIVANLHSGNMGSSHGRSYMKDKRRAGLQDIYGLAKVCFGQAVGAHESPTDSAAAMFAIARTYRPPAVLQLIADYRGAVTVHQRMGISMPATESYNASPPPVAGRFSVDDEDNLSTFWSMGAITCWQPLALNMQTIQRYGLASSPLFRPVEAFVAELGTDMSVAGQRIQALPHQLPSRLLSEVEVVTHRVAHAQLSSALDYRPGAFGDQYHAWQATLSADATVFTTCPWRASRAARTRFADNDGYWTGEGAMPRSAQVGATALHLYAPKYVPFETGAFAYFRYEDMTHAWFPQNHFDEVVQRDGWTFGRVGDGYVGLWSWRSTEWIPLDENDPPDGFTKPYDLVARGGATNVWICEIGDEDTSTSFEEFRRRCNAGAPTVEELPAGGLEGPLGGFAVTYKSPNEGLLEFATTGPLRVGGDEQALLGGPRHQAPWAHNAWGAIQHHVEFQGASLLVDPIKGLRTFR